MEKLNLLLLTLMVMSHSALTEIVIQVQQKVGSGDSQPRDLEDGGGDTGMGDSTTGGIMATETPTYYGGGDTGMGDSTTGGIMATETPTYCGEGVEIPSSHLVGGKIFNNKTASVEEAKIFCESCGSSILSEPPLDAYDLLTFMYNLKPSVNGFWIDATKTGNTWTWTNGDAITRSLIMLPEKEFLYMGPIGISIYYKGQDSTFITEHFVLCVD